MDSNNGCKGAEGCKDHRRVAVKKWLKNPGGKALLQEIIWIAVQIFYIK